MSRRWQRWVPLVAVVVGGCAMSQPPQAGPAPAAAAPGASELAEIARAEEAMRAPDAVAPRCRCPASQ